MRVQQQVLSPGMQNAEKADGCPEVFGIGGHLQEGIRAGLEQQTIDLLLVLQGQRGQFMRQRKYDMEVAHGEDFALPFGDPLVAGRRLALGAMPVTTRNGVNTITCLMGSVLFWGVAVMSERVAGSCTLAQLSITVGLSAAPSTCQLGGTCPCGGEAEPLPRWPPASLRDRPGRRSPWSPGYCDPATVRPS